MKMKIKKQKGMIKMKNTVICIGRQYGSGGYEIAKKVAEKLSIPFYDKELVELAAKKGNLHDETVKRIDEKAANSFLYSIVTGNYSIGNVGGPLYYDMPINDKLFLAQSEVIKEVAQEGSCVILGRCADYVLAEEDVNLISAYVYADMDSRINSIMEKDNLSRSKAKDRIIKTEKQRRAYYDYYTNREWGKMTNYDLCLSSSSLSVDACVDIIVDMAEKKMR